ncbi:peroxiredoxin [Parashewanella hymeniacidonis]|uniref:peroxiredoxin n=1 Tax=Parashewanella hymeniacidonis TaxID=2807618 RepID=UPI003B848D1D
MKTYIVNLFISLIITLTFSFGTYATDLKVGDMAPKFELMATDGNMYKLDDYMGKQAVVLAFYPMANTRGCTIECRSLAKKGHMIKKYNAAYMMASVDDLDENREFAKKNKADFPMLSDPTKKVTKSYDVLNWLRVASRVTFYIGKDGRILHVDKNVNPETAAEDIAKNLDMLKVEPAQGF